MGGSRRFAVVLAAVLISACGGGAATTAPAASAPAGSPTAAVASDLPASAPPASQPPASPAGSPSTAILGFGGDPHLAAGVTQIIVKCGYPTVSDGVLIEVFGHAKDAFDSFVLAITATKVTIRVATGSGPTYTARQFVGTNVVASDYDALKGATVGGPVKEEALAGVKPGSIPTLANLAVTVDCGDFSLGTTTLHVKGSLPEGEIDGGMDDARVECDTGMGLETVILNGLMTIGGKPTPVSASVNTKSSSTFTFGTPTTHFLQSVPGTGGSVTGTTGTFAGDVIAQPSNDIPKLTMTLSGDATCGSSVTF